MVDPCRDDEFDEVMVRLRSGDETAATAVFRRFVDRLIALAASRFEPWMHDHADAEGVVMSAYKSFFVRNRRGDFDVADWEDLWALLACITVRKCGKRRGAMRAARRDARREIGRPAAARRLAELADRSPTPDEAAVLAETVERLFQAMGPDDRPIVELILMGYTAEEVAGRLDCSERTVRRVRQRAKSRLRRLVLVECEHEEVA
jgi:RNA polymerase sigma-70 factor, ECF subfamily